MSGATIQRKKVLVVEDSATCRRMLEHIIQSDPRLELAAMVESGEEALRLAPRIAPDVVSMDLGLPGMDGVETTRRLMSAHPTPIVVVSASVDPAETRTSMRALEAGALCVLEKPAGLNHRDFDARSREIRTQLYIMSEVKVLRRRTFGRILTSSEKVLPARQTWLPAPAGFRFVGIASSTGGPQALTKVLGGMGADFPLPIAVVQHITDSFLDGFVSWLDGVVPQKVVKAASGMRPIPGHVYVAPPAHHLTVRGERLILEKGEPVCAQLPSADPLFESIARSFGPAALGIILTGMGEDGARGLKALRDAGGYALGEDESTAVVFGMPAAAHALGAVHELLPLDRIAPRTLELTRLVRKPLG